MYPFRKVISNAVMQCLFFVCAYTCIVMYTEWQTPAFQAVHSFETFRFPLTDSSTFF